MNLRSQETRNKLLNQDISTVSIFLISSFFSPYYSIQMRRDSDMETLNDQRFIHITFIYNIETFRDLQILLNFLVAAEANPAVLLISRLHIPVLRYNTSYR